MKKQSGSIPDIQPASDSVSAAEGASGEADGRRRHFLIAATAAFGVAGVGLVAVPFLQSLRPSARAQALGGAVTVDLGFLEPGEQIIIIWRGKPVWVLRRTPAMLERLNQAQWLATLRDPDSAVAAQQPPYAQNSTRSIRPEYLVVVALCTHLGCIPLYKPDPGSAGLGDDWMGGYFCPCHGSRFDLAGRVTRNVPAPTNLVVPPHRFLAPDKLEIGRDPV